MVIEISYFYQKPIPMKPNILADYRERRSTLPSLLEDSFNVTLAQLPVGDYVLPHIVIERKRLDDFAQSIIT
jgi:ERCC4-type nuclease